MRGRIIISMNLQVIIHLFLFFSTIYDLFIERVHNEMMSFKTKFDQNSKKSPSKRTELNFAFLLLLCYNLLIFHFQYILGWQVFCTNI